MDFDGLMAQHAAATPFYKTSWFAGSAIAAAVLITATVVFWPGEPPATPEVAQTEMAPIDETGKALDLPEPEAAPTVQPPLPGVDIPFDAYTVDAAKGGTIEHASGSQLEIPANCFVDADGNPIEGEVNIDYREFHDIAEVFVSGIPMQYDSAGYAYQFETAGMLDIRGSQEGKPVFIAPGKGIDVELISDNEDPKFNLYYLDEEQGAWAHLGKDKVRRRAKASEGYDPKPGSEEIETIANNASTEIAPEGRYSLEVKSRIVDGKLVNGFIDTTYYTEVDYAPVPVAASAGATSTTTLQVSDLQVNRKGDRLEFNTQAEAQDKALKTIGNDCRRAYKITDYYPTKAKPAAPKAANDDLYRFLIDVNPEEFPEFTVYENTEFQVGPENTGFTSKQAEEGLWEDMILEEKVAGESFDVTFIRGNERLNLIVYPVLSGENLEAAQQEFKQKFAQYETKLATRKDNERKKEEEYLARLEELREEAEAAAEAYQKRIAKRAEMWAMNSEVVRSFTVQGFGIFNCDSPQKFPKGAVIAADIVDEDGQAITAQWFYLAEKSRKALFTYGAFDSKVRQGANHTFRFNPKKRNVAWCVTDDAKLAIYEPALFASLPRDRQTDATMQMRVIDTEITNVDQVRKLLDM